MCALPRRLRVWLVVGTIATACSTPDDAQLTAPGAARLVVDVQIHPRLATLPFLGDTLIMTARAIDSLKYAVEGRHFSWASSDSTVATVSAVGVLTAIRAGSATITASTEGVAGSAAIHVDPGLVVDNTCASCHWERKKNGHFVWPVPEAACFSCHPQSAASGHWTISLGHEAASAGFPLEGRHEAYPCEACHMPITAELEFTPTSVSDCVACHHSDYDRQHSGSGVPTACVACHVPTRWRDVRSGSGHGSDGLQLVGVHADLACSACHDAATFAPRFAPTDANDCVACHRSDYDRQHLSSGFPLNCASCHTPTRWTDATFDHDADYFPIFSGKHGGKWQSCATCHTAGTDFSSFTCFSCHKHNRADMDDKHDDVTGYSYVSSACLSCHPDGRE